jgi:hypothetical protein
MCDAKFSRAQVNGKISLVGYPRKDTIHTLRKPNKRGIFFSNGFVWKCLATYYSDHQPQS